MHPRPLYSDSGSKHGQASSDTRIPHRVNNTSESDFFKLGLAARQGSVNVATERERADHEYMRRENALDARAGCTWLAEGAPEDVSCRVVSCRVVSRRVVLAKLSCAVSIEAKQRAREQTVADLRGRVRPRWKCRRTPDEWKGCW